jgi:hypothetical protein
MSWKSEIMVDQVLVVSADNMNDKTLIRHMEARHPLPGMRTYHPSPSDELNDITRAFHDAFHRIHPDRQDHWHDRVRRMK